MHRKCAPPAANRQQLACGLLTREGGEEPGPERLGKRHGGVTRHWTAKPPGLGRYRRLCLRPPIRLPSFRDGIRWASELKTPAKEVPSPTGESYLPNWAILLVTNLKCRAVALGFEIKREGSPARSPRSQICCMSAGTQPVLVCAWRVSRPSANWGAGQPALWR
jgi:hypothetical protein